MSNKQRGLLVIFIVVISTVMISACTQSLSTAPAATPTSSFHLICSFRQ